MSSEKCVECGEEVHANPFACPHRGALFHNDKGPEFLKHLPVESGWCYKGRNWGWLSLLQFLVILFFLIPQELIGLIIPMFLSFTFTAYLWVGAKDFFRGGL